MERILKTFLKNLAPLISVFGRSSAKFWKFDFFKKAHPTLFSKTDFFRKINFLIRSLHHGEGHYLMQIENGLG